MLRLNFRNAPMLQIADALMIATVVSLPWSTSATSILIGLWLPVVVLAVDGATLRSQVQTLAGVLPVVLCLLGLLGMLWADVDMHARWGGFSGFVKLLIVPLLLAQFQVSPNGQRVLLWFLYSCTFLLVVSFVVAVWPHIPRATMEPGVPVKTYILQSVEFTICAAVLAEIAVDYLGRRNWLYGISLLGLAAAFLFDVLYVATGRTALVIIPVLAALFAIRRWGRRGLSMAIIVGAILAISVWSSSPYLRQRVDSLYSEIQNYEKGNTASSAGERLAFWATSLEILNKSPFFGHGTGSIEEMFTRQSEMVRTVSSLRSTNPHNQTFAVGIQLGALGMITLWVMWVSQIYLFRGPGLISWVGTVVVAQNVVGSLFNSFIFDFSEGWLYVLGVGILGGMLARERRQG